MKTFAGVLGLALGVSVCAIGLGVPASSQADEPVNVNVVNVPLPVNVVNETPGNPASATSVLADTLIHTLLATAAAAFSLTDVTVANLGPAQQTITLDVPVGITPSNVYAVVVPPGVTFTQSFRTPIEFPNAIGVFCGGCGQSSNAIVTVSGRIH